MRIAHTVFLAAFVTTGALAQSVPNGSFETWASVFGSEEPTGGWFTPNLITAGYPAAGVTKTTDAAVGTYAVKLVSGHVVYAPLSFDDTTALLATGIASMSGAPQEGFAYTGRPTTFTFYYKYEPQTAPGGVDTARIFLRLSKWNSGTSQRDKVGQAMLKLTSAVASYTQAQLTIGYNLPDNPDTAYIDITSSLSGMSPNTDPPYASALGNTLYVDGFDLVMATAAQARPTLTSLASRAAGYTLSDLAGRRVAAGRGNSIDASRLAPGAYVATSNGAGRAVANRLMVSR
jgi:hypothetical protein